MSKITLHYIKNVMDEKTACGLSTKGVVGSPLTLDTECKACRRTSIYRKVAKKLDLKEDTAKRGFSCGVEVACFECSWFDNCRWLIRHVKV